MRRSSWAQSSCDGSFSISSRSCSMLFTTTQSWGRWVCFRVHTPCSIPHPHPQGNPSLFLFPSSSSSSSLVPSPSPSPHLSPSPSCSPCSHHFPPDFPGLWLLMANWSLWNPNWGCQLGSQQHSSLSVQNQGQILPFLEQPGQVPIPTLLAASPSFCSLSDRASALSLISLQYIREILHMSCRTERKPTGLNQATRGPPWAQGTTSLGVLAPSWRHNPRSRRRKLQVLVPSCTNLQEIDHDHEGFLRVWPVELFPGCHDLGVAGGQVNGGCAVLVIPVRLQLRGREGTSLNREMPSQRAQLLLHFGALWPIISSLYPSVITRPLWRVEMRVGGAARAPCFPPYTHRTRGSKGDSHSMAPVQGPQITWEQ